MYFVTKATIEKIKKKGRPSKSKALNTKTWFLNLVYRMHRENANSPGVEYREALGLWDQPSHMEIGLCWYQMDN